ACLRRARSASALAAPPHTADTQRYYQHLGRFSAAFELLSDVAMGTLGGSLKFREKISGPLAHALAYMCLASAALKRYHDEAKTTANYNLARWGTEYSLYRIQE